jgi:hypothetical protein
MLSGPGRKASGRRRRAQKGCSGTTRFATDRSRICAPVGVWKQGCDGKHHLIGVSQQFGFPGARARRRERLTDADAHPDAPHPPPGGSRPLLSEGARGHHRHPGSSGQKGDAAVALAHDARAAAGAFWQDCHDRPGSQLRGSGIERMAIGASDEDDIAHGPQHPTERRAVPLLLHHSHHAPRDQQEPDGRIQSV